MVNMGNSNSNYILCCADQKQLLNTEEEAISHKASYSTNTTENSSREEHEHKQEHECSYPSSSVRSSEERREMEEDNKSYSYDEMRNDKEYCQSLSDELRVAVSSYDYVM